MLDGAFHNGYRYLRDTEALTQLCGYRAHRLPKQQRPSFENSFSAHRIEQASWIKEVIHASGERVMLIDSTEIGVNAPHIWSTAA